MRIHLSNIAAKRKTHPEYVDEIIRNGRERPPWFIIPRDILRAIVAKHDPARLKSLDAHVVVSRRRQPPVAPEVIEARLALCRANTCGHFVADGERCGLLAGCCSGRRVVQYAANAKATCPHPAPLWGAVS